MLSPSLSRTGEDQSVADQETIGDPPILEFAAPMPGFPALTRFVLVQLVGEDSMIFELRSTDNPDVRFSVACGLLGYAEPTAVDALLELSVDADDEVRDWATFGIGSQIDLDTPEIRAALFARLEDANPDVQSEALVGLARRKDPRALPIIADHLQSSDLQLLDLDAAARFADPSLLPLLEQIELDPTDEEAAKCLADAIQACRGLLKSHSPTTHATGLQEKPTD